MGGGRLFATSLVFTRVGGPTAPSQGPGWHQELQMTLLWQWANSSAPSPAWQMPGAWHKVGGRQECSSLLPTPSQGPQNTFE